MKVYNKKSEKNTLQKYFWS